MAEMKTCLESKWWEPRPIGADKGTPLYYRDSRGDIRLYGRDGKNPIVIPFEAHDELDRRVWWKPWTWFPQARRENHG